MPFAEINHKKIYYETHGRGEDVVLLHHGFGCTKMWKEIHPGLSAGGYRVIMYDRRGYGSSEPGAGFEEFYMSEDFRPASLQELSSLTEYLGLKSFHLIGQCEGGVIGVDYAASCPEQVKSLLVSSTQCFSMISMPEFNRQKFPKSFSELDLDLRQKLTDWHGEHAEPFFELFRNRGGAYGTGFFDLRPVLEKVTCPTLVLYPDRSFLFDVEQALEFYRHLSDGELSILPRCGHNTYENRPSEYVRIALDFLERSSRKG